MSELALPFEVVDFERDFVGKIGQLLQQVLELRLIQLSRLFHALIVLLLPLHLHRAEEEEAVC